VGGFETPDAELSGGGIQATGNYPGKATTIAEMRTDLEKVLSLLPGKQRLNLHAIYGDFGLSGGGAAGFELDRVDYRLGSPLHTVLLARSENHTPENFVVVPEELLTHLQTWPGEPPEKLVRAEMIYFETAQGGAVFSVGSITYCGSLPHNNYDNNISRITNNVLTRFRTM